MQSNYSKNSKMINIPVKLGEKSYGIYIQNELIKSIPIILKKEVNPKNIIIISQDIIIQNYGKELLENFNIDWKSDKEYEFEVWKNKKDLWKKERASGKRISRTAEGWATHQLHALKDGKIKKDDHKWKLLKEIGFFDPHFNTGGFLTNKNSSSWENKKQAIVAGAVLASFTCEAFGTERLFSLNETEWKSRAAELQEMSLANPLFS